MSPTANTPQKPLHNTRNQFINFPAAYDRLLAAVYQQLFQELPAVLTASATPEHLAVSFAPVLQAHHARLRKLLAAYCLAYQPQELDQHLLLQAVPCEEYSARLQMDVLNLELSCLREPILDLGCGTSGTLVRFLRDQGLAACGLDRLAPQEEGFWQADWLTFEFAPQTWGTIIAHQAFSTHFLYHHQHQPQYASTYAAIYLSILDSLRPGGAFYYAPGLPFFEAHLTNLPAYRVLRTPLSLGMSNTIHNIAYATRVCRSLIA